MTDPFEPGSIFKPYVWAWATMLGKVRPEEILPTPANGPIVVSDGYLMAERVRKFELGEVIPEGNAEALVAALRRMLAPGYLEELRGRARWKDYREAHSVGRLTNAMEELVAAL